MRARDYDFAAATARASQADIDIYHRAFKKECWATSKILTPLVDFSLPEEG